MKKPFLYLVVSKASHLGASQCQPDLIYEPIAGQCFHFISPSEHQKNLLFFCCFQGLQNEKICQKWTNEIYVANSFQKFTKL